MQQEGDSPFQQEQEAVETGESVDCGLLGGQRHVWPRLIV